MKVIFKPKKEILDDLDYFISKAFPIPKRRQIKQFLKDNQDNMDQIREDTLDEVEGLIIRFARTKLVNDLEKLIDSASLPTQACFWERFQHLIKFTRENPDDPQMMPNASSRYFREGLSSLWHTSREGSIQ